MISRGLKVCFVVESGTDTRLVEGLSERADLTVLARAIPGGHAISQPSAVKVEILPPGRAAFAVRVFRRLWDRPRHDVVLVQGYGPAALAANLAARLRRVPCWMLVCSPVAEYYGARRRAGAAYSPLVHAGLHLLGWLNGRINPRYVVLSAYLARIVSRYAPGARIEIVPVYGVDVHRFTDRPDRGALRARRGLPSSGSVIFTSSRVAPEKDAATLLAAFASLVASGRDVYLLHRSGGYEAFLREAARAGVAARVIATDAADPRGDLPLDYAAVDVCVQASREEGLGFSVLEALACGTPVVATGVGGLLETIQDGITGWSVPPGDPAALAAAIAEVLDDRDEARGRAARGAALVRERFASGAVFDRLVDVLGPGERSWT